MRCACGSAALVGMIAASLLRLRDDGQVLRTSHCVHEGSGALIPLWGASSCDGAFTTHCAQASATHRIAESDNTNVATLQQEYETECATVCKGEPMCLLAARTAADIRDRRTPSARQHAAQMSERWQGAGS